MKTIAYSFFLISLSFIFLGCPSDKPPIIIPPTPTSCEYPPGNRNFSWRLDTVAWFPSWIGGVHAFSDSDAWIMGDIVYPNGESYSAVRWDGTSWNEKVDFPTVLMNANDVTGDNNLLIGVGYRLIAGEKAAIAEYNNTTKKWTTYQFEKLGDLRSVWTDGKGYFIAVGDNGMVYTKNSYNASWVYQKAPSGFNIVKVTGVSKSEIYMLGDSAIPGGHFQQLWKYSSSGWNKLMDNFDSTNTTIQIPESGDAIYDLATYRYPISDSLYMYIVGRESFIFLNKGNSSTGFVKNNLASQGLPLSALQIPVGRIFLFSPNDYWITGLRYYSYHYNGVNFQKMVTITTLPYGDLWGATSKIQKMNSGMIWIVLEMHSQVYAVLQGKP